MLSMFMKGKSEFMKFCRPLCQQALCTTLLQSAGANTMKKTDWENMDLGGGGGGAKAAEIFK